MSDGSLRTLAIVVALLQAPERNTASAPLASDDAVGQGTLVIEGMGHSLHPSHAQLLMGLMRDEVHRRQVRVLATTHGLAVLDALTGDEHRFVVVCERDSDGRSHLRRLVDLPNYVDIVAAGTIGRAAEQDRLRTAREPTRSPSEILAEVVAGPS